MEGCEPLGSRESFRVLESLEGLEGLEGFRAFRAVKRSECLRVKEEEDC